MEEQAELSFPTRKKKSSPYAVERIRKLFVETKGQRAVKPEHFFLRKVDLFSDQEVFRLKKLIEDDD